LSESVYRGCDLRVASKLVGLFSMGFGPFVREAVQALLGRPGQNL
jgi:hypothetical protein